MSIKHGNKEIEDLKNRLVVDRKSMKWFYRRYILNRAQLSYKEFLEYINTWEIITFEISEAIEEYFGETK